MIYIFDIDKTLTESDAQMSRAMAEAFRAAMAGEAYYFCSGATFQKMCWRLPKDIVDNAAGLFSAMGGELWQNGRCVYSKHFMPPQKLLDDLEHLAASSAYPHKEPPHVENRGSMLCFSTLGCFAEEPARRRFYAWEASAEGQNERQSIAQTLRDKYPTLSVTVGGKTSIDISPQNADKRQVLPELRQMGIGDNMTFYADKIFEGGIDYPLAQALQAENDALKMDNKVYPVTGPCETYQHLIRLAESKANHA